ncbi:MAG: hypothetical protein WAL41_12210, partial [Mycobacterium sp.]
FGDDPNRYTTAKSRKNWAEDHHDIHVMDADGASRAVNEILSEHADRFPLGSQIACPPAIA